MKADSLHMGKVFSSGGDVHYVLPHFQREYAWEKPEWQTLLKDLFSVYKLYDPSQTIEHFMGALVVINDGTRAGTVPVFRLVDGQQRLTTVSLLLCALGELVQDDENYQKLHGKIKRILLNQSEEDDLYYKLLPTLKYGDRASYVAILNGETPPPNVESQIPRAYEFLRQQLAARLKSKQFEPGTLFNVIMTSLQVVFIKLTNSERPYEIFESLNYKGKSLTQADLVRNYIAMKLPPAQQEAAFIKLWSPIEETLLEKRTVGRSRLGELTAFLRHYFAYLSGVLVNKDHVYSRFRDRGEDLSTAEFEAELATIKRFAGYYDRLLRPENEPDTAVSDILQRLTILESTTAFPFLLFMYDHWQERGKLSRKAFLAGLHTLEIYMVRRFLARESTNYLNKMFPTLSRDVDLDDFEPSLRQILGTKNEPSDTRLRQSAETVKLYDRTSQTRQKLGLIFDTVNRHLSQGKGAYTVLDADPTIEHIMPQTLTEGWKQHLGERWMLAHELLHTLGNLTVVTQEWNSQLSNAIYDTKREKQSAHGLTLNNHYFGEGGPETWREADIRARAQWLIEMMTTIWPQLGETAVGWEERPRAVVIIGETYQVDSWRDVLRRTADFVAQWSDGQFEEDIAGAEALSSYIGKEPFNARSHQLPNGWWINVNHNADWIRHLSESLIEAAGIPEDEFEYVLW